MRDEGAVNGFITAKKRLLDSFGCLGDYLIKVMDGCEWKVFEGDGMYFLTYYDENKVIDAAVPKKDGGPLLYDNGDYTLVIAIDCIKMGFVFENRMRK